jgi:hypothetical protein
MLAIVGFGVVSIMIVILRLRVPAHVHKAAALGWMSEQWLAEQRASHPL